MNVESKKISLSVGRVYRAKKPVTASGFYNDRQIIYANAFQVQYDGPAVGHGRRYPKVDRAVFEKWAGRDVTDELPSDAWQPYAAEKENEK